MTVVLVGIIGHLRQFPCRESTLRIDRIKRPFQNAREVRANAPGICGSEAGGSYAIPGSTFGRVVADAKDFLQRGNSRNRFQDTIFEQCSHAQEPRLPADGLSRLAVERHLTN